jgi:adenylate cyclase
MAKITKLWRRNKFSDYGSVFEAAFDREIMQSERRRALIVFIISCITIIWFFIVKLFFMRFFPRAVLMQYYGYTIFDWLSIIFGGLALYELVYAILLMIFLKKEKMFPFFPRFANAFVEVSIPTLIIYLIFKITYSIQSLFTPVLFIYFIFISLSSLRLLLTLSLFTGLVAGIEYIMVSMYIVQHAKFDNAYITLFSSGLHITKGLLLFLVGLVTGLVSQQIKKRMKRSIKTAEEKNRIINMFGQHVSPEVVNKLLRQKGELDSETRYVCMMFLDIRNFTKFTETKEPEEVVNYLNTLFDFMIDVINENKGIINKFLGDGFMAVFGAPFSDGADSINAVNAARGIISQLEKEVAAGRIPDTRVGIGIHAGHAMTGNVGSSQRKEYTIIGDVVNLAARIEQLNKQYDSQLLVSEEVWKSMGERERFSKDLGLIEIRGHAEKIHIYRLA